MSILRLSTARTSANCKQFCNTVFNGERCSAQYVQGQSPGPRLREYFYYIDHQGMLFLDDARIKNFTSCFKEQKFLEFFFKRLERNQTGRYADYFPYVSLCGRERNFVRCDDLPIVFTKLVRKVNAETGKEEDWFGYAHAEQLLAVRFEPDKIFTNTQSGRLYHPAPNKAGGIGLIQSKIAIEFGNLFTFEADKEFCPTHFVWRNKKYQLNCQWYMDIMMKLEEDNLST